MASALENRRLPLYLLGNAMSTFGDFALFLAMAIWVKSLTGSTSQAGFVMFSFAAGRLMLPLSGVLIDRVRRRPLLIIVNLLAAALVLALLAVRGRQDVPLIYVVMVLYGVAGSIAGPAESAFLPAIVAPENLAAANGMLQSIGGLLRAVAPVAGAGLFAWLGGGAVAVIDAATFVIAAATLAAITVREPAPQRRETSWVAEITGGARFIAGNRVPRQLVIACGLVMIVIGFLETAIFALVTVGLHHAPTFVAVLSTMQAVGTIAGGITAAVIVKRAGEGRAAVLGMVLAAACGGLLTVAVLPVVILAMLGLGVSIPWLIVGVTTALQRRTPTSLQGRVFATFEFGVTVPQTASIALGAGLITVLPYRALFATVGAVTLLAALFLASRREQREKAPAEQRSPEPAGAASTAGSASTAGAALLPEEPVF